MKYRSSSDTVHCFLLVFPRCKCMPSVKPLSLVVTDLSLETEHFDHAHQHAQAHTDAQRGYHISTPLLHKDVQASKSVEYFILFGYFYFINLFFFYTSLHPSLSPLCQKHSCNVVTCMRRYNEACPTLLLLFQWFVNWTIRGPGFDTRSGYILSFLLPLFQEGQLSVTGEICARSTG